MKKTLIALMALAGVASAALTEVANMSELIDGAKTAGTITLSTEGYDQEVYTLNNGAWYGITNEDLVDTMGKTTGVITMSAWINLDSASNYNMVFGWGATGTGFKFGTKGDDLAFVTKNKLESVSDQSIAAGEWTLVSLSYNLGDTCFRLYVDDENQGFDNNRVMNAVTVKEFAIGSANGNATSGTENFSGQIAGVKVFYSEDWVSGAEIVAAMSAAPTINVVPEPATATLSLLALAGLAARRRRK